MIRLIDANLEIANIRPNVEFKDRMFINVRMCLMPAVLSWLVQKSIRNRIDIYRQSKHEQTQPVPEER